MRRGDSAGTHTTRQKHEDHETTDGEVGGERCDYRDDDGTEQRSGLRESGCDAGEFADGDSFFHGGGQQRRDVRVYADADHVSEGG